MAALLLSGAVAGSPDPVDTQPRVYESVLGRIAAQIEQLEAEYPQLADFSAASHFDRDRLAITYGYKTHPARQQGGWTSGVPNPDEYGVWFYIDFHRPDSQAEIHTQPMVPKYNFGDRKVTFLILEGEKTRSVHAAIIEILLRNGVSDDESSPGR